MPFLWFLLEFIIFFKLSALYGFFTTFAFYLLPSFMGLVILIYYPKAFMASLQKSISLQEKPSRKMLHSLFIIISAVFFIIPTLTTRVIGLFLFLPILRHILVFIMIWQWYRFAGRAVNRFQNYAFKFGGAGSGFAFYSSNLKGDFVSSMGNPSGNTTIDLSREVTDVIDVKDVTREVIDVQNNLSAPTDLPAEKDPKKSV